MRKTSSRWPSLLVLLTSILIINSKEKTGCVCLSVFLCLLCPSVFVADFIQRACARAYPFFVCFVLHTNSGLCSPTKFKVLSVRPLSPAVLVPYYLSLVSVSASGVAPLP